MITFKPHFLPNSKQSFRRIIPSSYLSATPSTSVPSGTSSAMTPTSALPASLHKSIAASVCPLRSRTPPKQTRRGITWSGLRKLFCWTVGCARARHVKERSWAEIPVVTDGSSASMVIIYAVRFGSVLSVIIGGRLRRSASSGNIGAQFNPLYRLSPWISND